jgi:hypothetical protein
MFKGMVLLRWWIAVMSAVIAVATVSRVYAVNCEYDCKAISCFRFSDINSQWAYMKYVGTSGSCFKELWYRGTSAHKVCAGSVDRQLKDATGQEDCGGTSVEVRYAAKECVVQGEPFAWPCCASCDAQSS